MNTKSIVILFLINIFALLCILSVLGIMQQHENRLAQECLNLRYQIDVLTQMVKQ